MIREEYSPNTEEEMSNIPTLLLILAMIILYGVGIYAIISVIMQNPLAIAAVIQFLGALWSVIAANSKLVAIIVFSLLSVTIILMILILKLIAKIGREVTVFFFFSGPIVLLFIGIVTIFLRIY